MVSLNRGRTSGVVKMLSQASLADEERRKAQIIVVKGNFNEVEDKRRQRRKLHLKPPLSKAHTKQKQAHP